MMNMFKKMFGLNSEPTTLAEKQKAANRQDKEVRESMSEKQIDKNLKDTMEASDPVTKY